MVQISDNGGDASSIKDMVLFDVCCGTGTIGLTLAPFVKKVIGVEMCEQAVDDAKTNAKLNSKILEHGKPTMLY